MKKGFLLTTVILLLAAPAAFAGTYDLTFISGPGTLNLSISLLNGGTYNGGVYTGPYIMKVKDNTTGYTTNLSLVCIDGAILGDKNPYTLTSGSPAIPQQAAWIAVQMLSGAYSGDQLKGMQLAVWQLVAPGRITTSASSIQTIANAWKTATSAPVDYVLYIPPSQDGLYLGQRFIGVPEPSLPLLLGIGLLVVGPLALRRI